MKIEHFVGQYDFLSNFHRDGVPARGATLEHRFQAAKTTDPEASLWILSSASARQAKARGRSVHLRKDWDFIKDDVMLSLLRQKFQVPQLREKLLATRDAELIEGNWWGDRYWGVHKGEGQNMLGRLLMRVRDEVRVLEDLEREMEDHG